MSRCSTFQPASEGNQLVSRGFEEADRHSNKTFSDTQPIQQFEVDQEELGDHEGDLFFYEFDIEEEYCRLKIMKELETRRAWAERHELREEKEGAAGEEEDEETSVSLV